MTKLNSHDPGRPDDGSAADRLFAEKERYENISRLLPPVIYVILTIGAFVSLLKSGFGSRGIIQAIVLLTPVVALILIANRAYWPGIMLAAVAVPYRIPIAVLHRLPIATILLIFLMGICTLRRALGKGLPRITLQFDSLCMTGVLMILGARFVYDRPGSAMFGQTGGGGEAAIFILSVMAYFLFSRITAEHWDHHRNLIVLVLILSIITCTRLLTLSISGAFYLLLSLFNRTMWLLAPIVLSLVIHRQTQNAERAGPPFLSWVIMLLIIAMAAVSPHRSRPFFAAGSIITVSFVYYRASTNTIFLASVTALVLAVLLAYGGGELPVVLSRSFSTIVPVPRHEFYQYARDLNLSRETGWGSGFRAYLWNLAYQKISLHPIVGNGFTFSRVELMNALGASGAIEEASQALAVSGAYHNSVIELAVFCGVPSALLFVSAYIFRFIAFVPFARKLGGGNLKIICAGSLGFLTAVTGQMLMNGGSYDFFTVCLLMGYMRGIQNAHGSNKDRENSSPDNAVQH
ncbi:MAG: hypothetical protein R6V03_10505 [Kiritimatiellia bacterium]